MNLNSKIAHLGFIQTIINRMGNNSFLIKGWVVALVAALFALAAKDSNALFINLAFIPVLVFWIFDAYFIHQERLFRKLYEKVADDSIGSENFTLDTIAVHAQVKGAFWTMFSKTLLPFYGFITLLMCIFASAVLDSWHFEFQRFGCF